MAMRAQTVEILIDKAQLDPRVALAVAEAIDNEVQVFQPVTEPVLDGRFAALTSELRALMVALESRVNERFAHLETGVVRWIFLVVMGQTTLLTGIMYFLLQHTAH